MILCRVLCRGFSLISLKSSTVICYIALLNLLTYCADVSRRQACGMHTQAVTKTLILPVGFISVADVKYYFFSEQKMAAI